MKTFTASPHILQFMLKTKNTEAAQNQLCEIKKCELPWKDHFAGKSSTIPMGACPFEYIDAIT